MKNAVLQVADTGPLESLVTMLHSAGYKCWTIDQRGRNWLREVLKFDTVLDIDSLVSGYGYPKPISLPEASIEGIVSCDLFVDVKAHRNGPKLWDRAPHMEARTLWYRINGGEPEVTIHGDEVNPNVPVLTPNQWYKDKTRFTQRSYTMWPPFHRFDQYGPRIQTKIKSGSGYSSPITLIHNFAGWGYGLMIPHLLSLGVRIYGARSPSGMIQHHRAKEMLRDAVALVHPKSNDAPGYALYEAIASMCPIICTRRLIWRCKMEELLIPDVTCKVFDEATHDSLTEQQACMCTKEISAHLESLGDPTENTRIATNAYNRFKEIVWDQNNSEHVRSFSNFLRKEIG